MALLWLCYEWRILKGWLAILGKLKNPELMGFPGERFSVLET
jgi:hypothetical protein